jgi:hypothetical protein
LVVVIAVLSSGLLAGCAAKKYVMAEKPEGVALKYHMQEGDVLQYEWAQESTQTMEPMGMPMETKIHKSYAFSAAPKALKGDTYDLEITIGSMDASISTVQGEFSADVEPVIGKSFTMSISRLGETLDVSEAEAIHYGVGPQGTRSIMPDFKTVFPDLPGGPVSIGDTWTTLDTLDMEEGGIEILVTSESVNTLVGFETVSGLECAKVTAEVTGAVSGQGEQQGAQVSFEGTVGGTETWYFAKDEGLFIKMASDLFSKSTINVTGPSEMSFPLTEKTSLDVALIR